MKNAYYVYIVTNKYDKVFYIGVTNDIQRRIFEHKGGLIKSFSKKYNLTKLVYFEEYTNISDAIKREKQLKNWHRDWKIKMIKQKNNNFKDLLEN
jgi:putative endonuclease